MDFGLWLKEKKISQTQAAQDLDYLQGTINNFIKGRGMPGCVGCAKIMKYSHDMVRPEDFVKARERYLKERG